MLSTAAATLLASLLPLPLLPSPVRAAADLVKAEVKPDQAPKQAEYDPTDEKLRDAASLLQQALNANDVKVGSLRRCLSNNTAETHILAGSGTTCLPLRSALSAQAAPPACSHTFLFHLSKL